MYLQNYIQMWSDMCQQHIPSFQFYRLNHNEMSDSIRNTAKYPMLQLEEYDGIFKQSEGGSKFMDYQKCAIIVLDKMKVQDYNDEHIKLNNLKKWGAQFFARIIQDNLLQRYCPTDIMRLDESSIEYFLTDVMTENVRGWRIEFTLICNGKEMNYDSSQWQP